MEKPNFDLDRLLKSAYPSVEVSSDFTFRLWRKLLDQPARFPWIIPIPVVGLAAAAGVMLGLWNWSAFLQPGMGTRMESVLRQPVRLDLFGNAPLDSLAGSYLRLAENTERV